MKHLVTIGLYPLTTVWQQSAGSRVPTFIYNNEVDCFRRDQLKAKIKTKVGKQK